jgi:probable addiction module antidote protein
MKTKNYDEFLKQELTDTSLAAEYLSSAIKDGSIDEFLLALRNVAEAHGGIGALSEIANLNRQSMYKMLSEDGNPTLSSLLSVLKAIGINLNFTSDDEKEAA